MENNEQALDKWLEEHSKNKMLLNRLTIAKQTAEETKDLVTNIQLCARDLNVIIMGLNKIIQSNKESIINCSYTFVKSKEKQTLE